MLSLIRVGLVMVSFHRLRNPRVALACQSLIKNMSIDLPAGNPMEAFSQLVSPPCVKVTECVNQDILQWLSSFMAKSP